MFRTLDDVRKFIKQNPNHPAIEGLKDMLFYIDYGDKIYTLNDFSEEVKYYDSTNKER